MKFVFLLSPLFACQFAFHTATIDLSLVPWITAAENCQEIAFQCVIHWQTEMTLMVLGLFCVARGLVLL